MSYFYSDKYLNSIMEQNKNLFFNLTVDFLDTIVPATLSRQSAGDTIYINQTDIIDSKPVCWNKMIDFLKNELGISENNSNRITSRFISILNQNRDEPLSMHNLTLRFQSIFFVKRNSKKGTSDVNYAIVLSADEKLILQVDKETGKPIAHNIGESVEKKKEQTKDVVYKFSFALWNTPVCTTSQPNSINDTPMISIEIEEQDGVTEKLDNAYFKVLTQILE